MIGHRVSFRITDGQSLWNMTFGGQIFMKMLEKSYSIVTVYAHSYIRYCWAREPHFIKHELSHIIPENVWKQQIQWIWKSL